MATTTVTPPFIFQLALSTVAQQCPPAQLAGGLTLKAPSTNTAAIAIGLAGLVFANGFILAPGDTLTLNVTNSSIMWVIGQNTSDVLCGAGL